jgi:hypothetical protein
MRETLHVGERVQVIVLIRKVLDARGNLTLVLPEATTGPDIHLDEVVMVRDVPWHGGSVLLTPGYLAAGEPTPR